MILEYQMDYRSDSQIYKNIFLSLLDKYSLNGKTIKKDFLLKLYIEVEDTDRFEEFSTEFAKKLPNSIFLYNTKVNVLEKMPEVVEFEEYSDGRIEMPFCLDCLEAVTNSKSKNYFNVFMQCDFCGYNIEGEHKNYKQDFERIAKAIANGDIVKINTFYGSFNIGKISSICNKIDFDIIAYDYATISKYTHAKDYELKALASIEKPFIRLKTNLKFKLDVEELDNELIRFKLADDFNLYLLMSELNLLGIDLIFLTKDDIAVDESLLLVDNYKEIEPIEIVASKTHIAIVKGDKGLKKVLNPDTEIVPILGATYSVIKEHNLQTQDLVGVYLSKKYQNGILLYGQKFGTANYLSLEFHFDSFKDIFNKITNTNESAKKLIENYSKKFPEHYERLLNISFEKNDFNIYELWGLVSIILDFTPSNDIEQAAKILEKNTLLFLGERGPRIDYKVIKIDNSTLLDPLMVIRSAMSFQLAGIDKLTLSYGVIESFAEFISGQLDEIEESVNIKDVVFSGSLLQNNRFFEKLVNECSINHNIYFNNQLLIDEKNFFYDKKTMEI